MINNCSSLLLLVALLSYNNHNCVSAQNSCGCNSCNCSNTFNQNGCTTSLGMDAGMLCLLLAFLTCGCNCNTTTSC